MIIANKKTDSNKWTIRTVSSLEFLCMELLISD